MKRLIYILLITLVLTGCGKVDKPVKEETINDVKEEVVQDVEVKEEAMSEEDLEETEDTTQTDVFTNENNAAPVEKVTMYAKSSVNVRSGAGTSNAKVGSLTKGQEVTKIGEENGWSKIEFNGTVGYVSSKYLSAEKVEAGNSNTGNTNSSNNNSSSTNTGNNNTTTNQNTVPSAPVHEHTWEEITEEKKVYYAWRTICNVCKLDMTDMKADEMTYHVVAVCGGSYANYYKEVDFVTTDYKIIVTNVGYKCSCGQTKEGTGASWVTDSHITIYTQGSN